MRLGAGLKLEPLQREERKEAAGLRYTPLKEYSDSLTMHRFSKANLIPISHSPRRMTRPEKKVHISRLDLQRCSQEIGQLLRSTSSRTVFTNRPVDLLLLPEAVKDAEDSLCQRYSEKDHVYTHELIGTVHLGSFAGRMSVRKLPRTKVSMKVQLTVSLGKPQEIKSEKGWKALSAIRHLIQLQVPLGLIPKLSLLVPQQPYTAANSFQFLMACKGGQTSTVAEMLRKSKWLALEYDSVKQTGLHWAAKRAHLEVAKLLLDNGAYVDSKDSVGRTSLYQACRKSHVLVVKLLLSYRASPLIKTHSGMTVQQVTTSPLIQKIVGKSSLVSTTQLHIILKFVPMKDRNQVWMKEGIEFFNAEPDVIMKSSL